MAKRDIVTELDFPINGVNRRFSHNRQPRLTTIDALNVLPNDALLGRFRGGSRPGLQKQFPTSMGQGTPFADVSVGDVISFFGGDNDELVRRLITVTDTKLTWNGAVTTAPADGDEFKILDDFSFYCFGDAGSISVSGATETDPDVGGSFVDYGTILSNGFTAGAAFTLVNDVGTSKYLKITFPTGFSDLMDGDTVSIYMRDIGSSSGNFTMYAYDTATTVDPGGVTVANNGTNEYKVFTLSTAFIGRLNDLGQDSWAIRICVDSSVAGADCTQIDYEVDGIWAFTTTKVTGSAGSFDSVQVGDVIQFMNGAQVAAVRRISGILLSGSELQWDDALGGLPDRSDQWRVHDDSAPLLDGRVGPSSSGWTTTTTTIEDLSGEPVRLLGEVRAVYNDGAFFWLDHFLGASLGAVWTLPPDDIPKPDAIGGGTVTPQTPIVDNSFAEGSTSFAVAAYRDQFSRGLDSDQDYSVEIEIRSQPNAANNYITEIYLRLDDVAPDITQNGVIIQIKDSVSFTDINIQSRLDGVLNVDTTLATITQGQLQGVKIKVEVSGDDVEVFFDGDSKGTQAVDAHTGTRMGFALHAEGQDGGPLRIDYFSVRYFPTDVIEPNQNYLVGSSGGSIYLETDGDMVKNTGTPTLAEDKLLQSVDRGGLLYITDHGLKRSGGDGIVNGDELTSPTNTDWTTSSAGKPAVSADDDVVVITGPTGGGATLGVYQINGVTASIIELASNPGDETSVTFRVERGQKVYNPLTNSLSLVVPDTGTLQPGTPLAALFQDRVTWAGDSQNPQVWYMSRQGDPLDYNYGASDGDVQRALAATSANAGQIGAPITALAAFGDDYLLFFTLGSTYVLRGNPAFGGTIGNLSRKVGAISRGAWTHGPSGELYFLSRDGLYMIGPGALSTPVSVSREKIPRELIDIPHDITHITMTYDVEQRAILINLTHDESVQVTNWMYQIETQSFWPITYPANEYEPTALLRYEADSPTSARSMLGCRDGFIRAFNQSVGKDDGETAFTSYIFIGPIKLGQGRSSLEGIVKTLRAVVAKDSEDVSWDIYVGDSAQDAFNAASFKSGTWSEGENATNLIRARGTYAWVKVSATLGPWALSELDIALKPTGREKVRL